MTTFLLSYRRIASAGAAAIIVIAAVVYYAHLSNARFDESFDRYIELAKQGDVAAYVPGIAQNSVRQRLNAVLVETLSGSLSSVERLDRAREGLALLDDSEKQINAIGAIGDELAVEIARMDLIVNSASDLSRKGAMRELVVLAKKRSEIVQDIRGLSYRANFETKKIFKRIVEDGGALTPTHITELNNELPTVEAQFNKRASLYEELEGIATKIDELHAAL